MKAEKIFVSDRMKQHFDKLATLPEITDERLEEYIQDVLLRIKKLTKLIDSQPESEWMATLENVYAGIDKSIESLPDVYKQSISCKKGCSACCHINVDIRETEAKLLVKYAHKNRIPIDKEYLQKQAVVEKQPGSDVSACVFLKDGLCSVYPVRPIMCRKYYVVSDPALCADFTFKPDILQLFDMNSEIFYIAYSASHKGDRMARQLLKVLNK
jgi:Fe-S-cluster containining protein